MDETDPFPLPTPWGIFLLAQPHPSRDHTFHSAPVPPQVRCTIHDVSSTENNISFRHAALMEFRRNEPSFIRSECTWEGHPPWRTCRGLWPGGFVFGDVAGAINWYFYRRTWHGYHSLWRQPRAQTCEAGRQLFMVIWVYTVCLLRYTYVLPGQARNVTLLCRI